MSESSEEVFAMLGLALDMWDEVGPKFTCSETNALVALFASLGLDRHAHALAEAHACGDYEEDEHWDGVRREGRWSE